MKSTNGKVIEVAKYLGAWLRKMVTTCNWDLHQLTHASGTNVQS